MWRFVRVLHKHVEIRNICITPVDLFGNATLFTWLLFFLLLNKYMWLIKIYKEILNAVYLSDIKKKFIILTPKSNLCFDTLDYVRRIVSFKYVKYKANG